MDKRFFVYWHLLGRLALRVFDHWKCLNDTSCAALTRFCLRILRLYYTGVSRKGLRQNFVSAAHDKELPGFIGFSCVSRGQYKSDTIEFFMQLCRVCAV